jgi:hypothetical protein
VTVERLKGSLKSVQPLSEHRRIPLLDVVKAIKSWLSAQVEGGSGYLFLSQKGGPHEPGPVLPHLSVNR